jgi:hypothetical protein
MSVMTLANVLDFGRRVRYGKVRGALAAPVVVFTPHGSPYGLKPGSLRWDDGRWVADLQEVE